MYHPVTTKPFPSHHLSQTITAKGYVYGNKKLMASTSGTKKPKGPKLPEKTYLPDSDSDEDAFDFSFLDFSKETFKAPSRLCDDQFLNLLCDKNILRRSIDGMVDDGDIPGVQQKEHAYLDEDSEDVGVEYRVHDPNVTSFILKKSDRVRVIAKCGSGTRDNNDNNKMVAAGWKYNERTFQIKFCNEMHLCARNYHFGSLVTSSWLAKHYLKDVIMKPKITLLEMQADVLQRFSVGVSLGQCQRARATALGMIEGKLEDHYAKVWDYAIAIRLSNPGTTCLVGVESNLGCNYFKRFYVGFKDFRDGWSRGCRRVKGEILTAIGRDADNHVYPIAWAVVNVENKDNWTWFIDNLVADLDLGAGNGLVVISDQHKGLLQAVADQLPHVEHRQCARHIFANFRKKFIGLELKSLFLEAAMSRIKKITDTGYTYLMARKPETWCRAFFSHGYACEAVENGVAERFNAMIKQIRKKPIITMLEEIRILLMKRFFHQGQEATKWRGNYGPNIQLKLNEFGKDMRLWTMVPSSGDVFETRYGYKVDLANHTCTCNLWMLSGIPCVHTQAAINYVHKDPSEFISSWFHKDKYNIQPVGGSNLWPMTEFIKPLPPPVRRMPGRPKVNKVKHASKSEDAKYPSQRLKVTRTVRCGKCQQLGDNKISCTNDEVPKPPVPKRKIGRLRKDGGGQPIFDQFPLVEPAIPRSDAAPPTVSECGDQVGGPDIPRSDVTPPPVSESGNQVGGPNVSPLKRTKMMERRGGKTKVSRSRNKTPKKTPNGKKHKSNAKEDVSLTCDEDFVDLFTHAPNGKQGMSQATEDIHEQEHDDNDVKVSERLTIQELLMSGYTHVDAVAAMKEVYGEVEVQQIEEKEAEEGVEEREVEEEEVEAIQVEQEEVEALKAGAEHING
uniref:SWIM-type domain-containing protein n=1 Tax=Lactuca sativa TaxID=4236 RepID=A0A9R1VDD1_LACSA|nr:hypothetical protein LSAT_V11C500273190 [Lactuca sativa]